VALEMLAICGEFLETTVEMKYNFMVNYKRCAMK